MQNWEYTFDPVSKEAWIQQIEQDLKGQSIDSLHKEWWPGEPLVPIHHFEDSALSPISLPKELFRDPPKIIERVNASSLNESTFNDRIIEALQFGAQVFEISSTSIDEIDIDIVLKNVVPGIIEWQISNLSLLQEFTKRESNHAFYHIGIAEDDAPLEFYQLQNLGTSITPAELRFEYYVVLENDFVDYGTRLFQLIVDEGRNWKERLEKDPDHFFNAVQLRLHADKDFFKCVVEIRAMHLLWQNLVLHFTGKPVLRYDYLKLIIQQKDEKPDDFLIRASMSALAGCLSGAGGISINKNDDPANPDFYRRINRNIFHLLHLESGLPKGEDPLAGAYTIDYYTRLWSERIWNNLKLE